MGMGVSFTDKQFKDLLLLAYLGEWVLSAHKENPGGALGDLISHLYSHAGSFGLGSLSERGTSGKGHFPSRAMEETAQEYLEDYDNDTFWEELLQRMAERDFVAAHGEAAIKAMPERERQDKLDEFQRKYQQEFEEHGLDRLALRGDVPA